MNKTWPLQLVEGPQSPGINWKMICPLTGFIGAGVGANRTEGSFNLLRVLSGSNGNSLEA